MKKKEKVKRIENPLLFVVVTMALAVSLGAIVFGFSRRNDDIAEEQQGAMIETKEEEESGLDGIFEKSFEDSDAADISDEFLKNDPYLKDCSSTAGDGLPAVVDGTVCLR